MEKLYLECLHNFCRFHNFCCSDRNRTNHEIKTILRSSFDKNDRILTIYANFLDGEAYYFDSILSARDLAEIVCPLGYTICLENTHDDKRVIITKNDSSVFTYFTNPLLYTESIVYMSEKIFRTKEMYPPLKGRITPYFQPALLSKTQFVGYLHWSARRNAMLIAYKYKKGAFFHTLKWIALFL